MRIKNLQESAQWTPRWQAISEERIYSPMWTTKIQLPNQIVPGVLGRWRRKSSLSQAVISSLSHESFCNNEVYGDVNWQRDKGFASGSDAILQYGIFLF